MEDEQKSGLIALTAEIVSAHAANNSVSTADVAALIGSVYATLSGLGAAPAPVEAEKSRGVVTARKSLSNSSHIISMIDGKPYKTLKRHLGRHGHTPASYREAFGLPHDYPMVAADYGAQRREIAKKIGLGRKPKAPDAVPAKALVKEAAKAPAKARAGTVSKPETATPAAAAPVKAPRKSVATPPVTGEATSAPKPAAAAPADASSTPRRKLKTVFGNALAAAKQHLGGGEG